MAFSFRAYQNAVTGLSILNFVDETDYTGMALNGRKIYLKMNNGEYLVPTGTTTDYIDWPVGSASPFPVDVLDKDYSLLISVIFDAEDETFNILSESGNNLITESSNNIILEN